MKSLKLIATVSSRIKLGGIQHDSETGDFFYVGSSYNPDGHFVSRMDYAGNLIWGKAYNNPSLAHGGSNHTLEYSPSYKTLYYTLYSSPKLLLKVNSLNGVVLNSFEIPEAFGREKLSLSRDELALYGSIRKSSNELVFFRFDTATSRINTKTI